MSGVRENSLGIWLRDLFKSSMRVRTSLRCGMVGECEAKVLGSEVDLPPERSAREVEEEETEA